MNKTNMLKDTIKVYKSQKTIYPNPLPVEKKVRNPFSDPAPFYLSLKLTNTS